ncbi:hypothetical protein KP005_17920 [Geomonas nitrogeniifigens]|uniref:Uncharacterized protein n=3 Tax=Geomonas diazotrophica TaxID=2843197 RepID=A0ABX8JJ92_9BACT|nr:hypothetical protein [Geomonas nitrogeniifigens]QWV97196.1 hypothetical protein KP005_17920 [Geomonas nitrogeniifigens]
MREMRCDYKDDFKIDYTDSLHITKGNGVDMTVKAEDIPANVKLCLNSAVVRDSCHELRAAARALTSDISKSFNIE